MKKKKDKSGPKVKSPTVRFLRKFEQGEVGECWEWQGTLNNKGYGVLYVGKDDKGSHANTAAHRFSYKHFVGEIPSGLQVYHLCQNPRCVNPGHLELVKNGESTKRAALRRTHFRCGHPKTENNAIKIGRYMACKTCHLAKLKRHGESPKFCPAGHEYTLENSYQRKDRPGHTVMCKICNRERGRVAKRAKRAAKKKVKT